MIIFSEDFVEYKRIKLLREYCTSTDYFRKYFFWEFLRRNVIIMKVALVLALCFVAVWARPQQDIQIVQAENDNPGDGNYRFTYALSDGTNREESGSLKQVGEVQAQTQQGVISWTSPEGQVITLRFTADENGYRPEGDHLPK